MGSWCDLGSAGTTFGALSLTLTLPGSRPNQWFPAAKGDAAFCRPALSERPAAFPLSAKNVKIPHRKRAVIGASLFLAAFSRIAFAQQIDWAQVNANGDAVPMAAVAVADSRTDSGSPYPLLASASPSELKKLPIEALVDVEITSASRRPENLWQTSSAVDVVTAEDIAHAGVTTIPDALRLATEVQVAQIDGHTWAVSVRGFNNAIANKVQVLMDGRSLYTPLFSGVFWDAQQTFLPDLEQIEIIRGPGATLWGANAVNGVINIRSKSAEQTQGFMFYGGGGFEEDGFFGARYGGKINDSTFYRVYVTHEQREGLPIAWDENEDDGQMTQGGFRIDSKLNPDDHLTVQGDFYAGNFDQLSLGNVDVDGENVLARWTHEFTADSSFMLMAYWDRTYRLIPPTFEEERNTGDVELQYSMRYGEHYLVLGGEYRGSHDNIANIGPGLAFIPDDRTVHLVSGYIQDEWHIIPDKVYLTAVRVTGGLEGRHADLVALDVVGVRVAAALVVRRHHVRPELAHQPHQGRGRLLHGDQREAALGKRRLGVALGPARVDEPQPVLTDAEDVARPLHLLRRISAMFSSTSGRSILGFRIEPRSPPVHVTTCTSTPSATYFAVVAAPLLDSSSGWACTCIRRSMRAILGCPGERIWPSGTARPHALAGRS